MKLKLLRKMKSTALKSGLACDRQGWRNGGILLDGFSGISERYLLSIVAWGLTSTDSRPDFEQEPRDSSIARAITVFCWSLGRPYEARLEIFLCMVTDAM